MEHRKSKREEISKDNTENFPGIKDANTSVAHKVANTMNEKGPSQVHYHGISEPLGKKI